MKSKIILMVLGLLLVLCVYSFSQVPQLINYQGKLTKSTGAPLDTTVQMIFSIYADSNGTILNWTETQAAVKVDKGIFNVLLGSVTPISSAVFNGSVRYLGVKVGGDPEITPRKPMVSVPYAYRAGSIQTNCHDCDSIFVNVAGPDSVYSSSGTAFLGKASGSSSSSMVGVRGYSDNTSTGNAYGGTFGTSSNGTGLHYGVSALASGSSSVFGGLFNVGSAGTGVHYGSYASSYASSSNPSYGVYGFGSNYSTGSVYGGYFETTSDGTGSHYGLSASAASTSPDSATNGVYGYGSNSSSGYVAGGEFITSPFGSGSHAGAVGFGYSSSAPYSTVGLEGLGINTSYGTAYGGEFFANAYSGTGYGIYSSVTGSGYAAYFNGNMTATGTKSAAVKMNSGEYRHLYCQESPENWFEDFGEGQLVNGKSLITLDPLFTQTVNTNITYHVFLTPGGDCNGLYVVNKTPTSFEVRELRAGNSSLTFSYRVVAKRKGYENLRLAKMVGPTPEEVQAEQAKQQAEMKNQSAKMEEERLKQEQERKQLSEQQVKAGQEMK